MEQNEIPEELLERIQKLMERTKEDSGSTQAEIETATNLITSMLLKYNLSMSQVQQHRSTKEKPITEANVDLNNLQTRHEAGWVNSLVNVICNFNLCKALHCTGIRKYDQGYMIIIGREHNIKIVMYFVEVLIKKIKDACKIAWKRYEYHGGDEKHNTFFRGFYRGAVNGIHVKLTQVRDELIRSQEKENKELGLMIISEKEKMIKYAQEKYNPRNGSYSSRLSGEGGKALGYATGKSMDLNKGVGGQGPKGLIN